MYKRKNWLMDRGVEGGSSSEDEDDLDNAQEYSSEEVVDEDVGSSEASESEDDYKGDQEVCQEQLQQESTIKEMSLKKIVKLCLKSDENELFEKLIYCSVCKKCQITDSQTLRKHIQSKKHVKRVEKAGLKVWESLQWVAEQFQENLESQQMKQSKRKKNKIQKQDGTNKIQKQDGINKIQKQDGKIKTTNQDEKMVKKQSRKAGKIELQNQKQSFASNKGKSKGLKQK